MMPSDVFWDGLLGLTNEGANLAEMLLTISSTC